MSKFIFVSVLIVTLTFEIADIALASTIKVGLTALVCTVSIFLLDRKIKDRQITSLIGYIAFALITLSHSHLINIDVFGLSDETYLTAILFAAGIPLTTSLQEAIG